METGKGLRRREIACGRGSCLSLSVDTIKEAERTYAMLSEGGKISMPIQETFFAFRFAMLRDTFGPSWMLLNERPMTQGN